MPSKCVAPRRYVLDRCDWIKKPLDRLWIYRGFRTSLNQSFTVSCSRCSTKPKVVMPGGTIHFDRPPKEKIHTFYLGQCQRCQTCYWVLVLGERLLETKE